MLETNTKKKKKEKEKKKRLCLGLLRQFNETVALLHRPLTVSTKVVVIHLPERNQQGVESAWCPTGHRMEVLSQ